jgi:hypothetical protein
MATNPAPGNPIKFTTTDILGNTVACWADTWIAHIVPEHPDMVGYDTAMVMAIENPDFIKKSTLSTSAAVFELIGAGDSGRDLRVVVKYDDNAFMKGGCTGEVMTAYPRDVANYPKPKVGEVLHTRGGTIK